MTKAYDTLPRPPFVAWLAGHGLLGTGRPWELRDRVDGVPVYVRRDLHDRMDLIVRPKRGSLENTYNV